jgi:hypothetical protein
LSARRSVPFALQPTVGNNGCQSVGTHLKRTRTRELNKSQLTFESERESFVRLKVFNITHRVAVSGAACLTAQLELGWEIQLNGWIIGWVHGEFNVLKDLSLFTSRSFAIRTPVDMHSILVSLIF